jgi:hypothetical protein
MEFKLAIFRMRWSLTANPADKFCHQVKADNQKNLRAQTKSGQTAPGWQVVKWSVGTLAKLLRHGTASA